MKEKQFILMDLDGTLTDPFEGLAGAVQYARKRFGMAEEQDLSRLEAFIGPPLVDSFREIYGFSEEQALLAAGFHREYFSERGWMENKVYPGIPEFLEAQRLAGRRLFVATSKPEPFAVKILEYFGLASYFDIIAGASLDRKRSKKTDVIRWLLSRAVISPLDRAIMIGDRKYDVLGAREVGIETIGVLYGYGSRQELLEAGAACIVPTVEVLSQLFGE